MSELWVSELWVILWSIEVLTHLKIANLNIHLSTNQRDLLLISSSRTWKGVEWKDLLWPTNKILSQWPQFSFDSDMILEFHAMSMYWPNVHCWCYCYDNNIQGSTFHIHFKLGYSAVHIGPAYGHSMEFQIHVRIKRKLRP